MINEKKNLKIYWSTKIKKKKLKMIYKLDQDKKL